MGNASIIFDFVNETLAQFLDNTVDDGTYDDVVVTEKVDREGKEKAATQIYRGAGKIWGNLMDDFIRAAYPYIREVATRSIRLDQWTAPIDGTSMNATDARPGLLRKLSGSVSQVLRGDGTWGSADGIDGTAIHDNVGSEISAVTAKATPTTSDYLLIEDAAATNAKKSVTIGSLPFWPSGRTSGTFSSDGSSFYDVVDLGTIPTNTAWIVTGEIILAYNSGGTVASSVVQFRGSARRSGGSASASTIGTLTNGTVAGHTAQINVSTNNIIVQAKTTTVITTSYVCRYTLTEITGL